MGAIEDWPAFKKWDGNYLRSKLKSTEVSVNITPNGLGDAILEDDKFVMPMEKRMKFEDFMNEFEEKKDKRVLYLSHQNDSFRTQFNALKDDVPDSVHFTTEAFGTKPDAVNLWIGDERSVTSLHKDHYENMYVLLGREVFEYHLYHCLEHHSYHSLQTINLFKTIVLFRKSLASLSRTSLEHSHSRT